ncbi:hypothetical protein [Kitasatospora sp. NRRL B-11411]|nr:hypothetical protein [Kitasatospora sp. NRRL B-11411]
MGDSDTERDSVLDLVGESVANGDQRSDEVLPRAEGPPQNYQLQARGVA